MFPRPSRFLRLLILLSLVAFLTISMYFMNLDEGARNSRIEAVIKDRISSFEHRDHGLGIRHTSLRFSDLEVTPAVSENHLTESEVGENFDEYVLRKLAKSRLLTFKDDYKELKVDRKTSTDEVNPHNFNYIHNPSMLCQRSNVTLLVYIHSSPVNLKKRQAVRETWGHPKLLNLYNASLVFVLGRVTDPAVQSFIDMESEQFGDILQEDFIDSYRNLTYKGVAGLKWATVFCKGLDFMLKTDDDILVDIVSLIENLYTRIVPERASRSKLVLCNVWTRMKVIRDPKSKWYISKEEFPEDYFPAYCSGSAFLLSADLVPALYESALLTPFFWVDDYYITGTLVNALKVQHTRFNSAYLLNYNVAEDKLKNDTRELLVFHVKKLSLFLKLWPILMRRHRGMETFLRPVTITLRDVNGRKKNNNTSHSTRTSVEESDSNIRYDDLEYADKRMLTHTVGRLKFNRSG